MAVFICRAPPGQKRTSGVPSVWELLSLQHTYVKKTSIHRVRPSRLSLDTLSGIFHCLFPDRSDCKSWQFNGWISSNPCVFSSVIAVPCSIHNCYKDSENLKPLHIYINLRSSCMHLGFSVLDGIWAFLTAWTKAKCAQFRCCSGLFSW